MIEVRLVFHRPCNFCGVRGHLDAPASLAFEAMVLMPRGEIHDDGMSPSKSKWGLLVARWSCIHYD
jgi:hypothetical protein